ncbi:MAG: metallophosphoesterase, partial [Bacillota bacterium]|nr:metallophosphoesterase [Bacillota bacterium]
MRKPQMKKEQNHAPPLSLLPLLPCCSLRLRICSYTESSPRLKAALRLALISDLHSCLYGQEQEELLKALTEQQPDLICLSGDIIDDKKPPEGARCLFSAIGKQYPCYYTSGNHEARSGQIRLLKEEIRNYGLQVLEGTGQILEIKGQRLYIAGVDDPSAFSEGDLPGSWQAQLDAAAAGLGKE